MQENRGEKKQAAPYGLQLDQREHLSLTGVQNVISFDESQVILNTEGGRLTVEGHDLHVARLMLDEGRLVLDGTVDSIVYAAGGANPRGGLMQRIFR